MQLERVIAILESLANGIDPTTNNELRAEAFLAPDVIRALFAAAAILRHPVPITTVAAASPPPPAPRAERPPAAGARWSQEEDDQVCRQYDSGATIAEIANKHQRTPAAITLRLVKLGRIDPRTVELRERSGRRGAAH